MVKTRTENTRKLFILGFRCLYSHRKDVLDVSVEGIHIFHYFIYKILHIAENLYRCCETQTQLGRNTESASFFPFVVD